MAHIETLFSSPLVQVQDVCCAAGRSGLSDTRSDAVAHVCMVRRGCFHYHLGPRTYFADSSRVLIHDDGVEYRTSHPCDGGDDCTVIVLTPELMAEAFGRRRRHEEIEFEMAPAGQVSHLAAYALLRHPLTERLAGEEAAIGLVQAIAGGRSQKVDPGSADSERLRIVRRVKGLLNDRLDENLSLSALARDAGCSPYHLMHQFRGHTGQTIRGYRARLRVAAALDLMVQGAWDLTDLALQCGFASHSHMSETFRAVLGMTPSELRLQLTGEALQQKRRFVQAAVERAA
jgi:AraC-like DNA-binding protein